MQILKENKDKKDAEFNERFKHSECSKFKLTFLSILVWKWDDLFFGLHRILSDEKQAKDFVIALCSELTHFFSSLQDHPKPWMMTRPSSLIL